MARKPKYDYEFVKNFVESQGYILLSTDEEYENSLTIINLTCPEGHEYPCTFTDFYATNKRCSTCGIKTRATKQTTPLEIVIKNIEEKGYKIIEVEYYINPRKSKITIECHKGHIRKSIAYKSFKRNSDCPDCSRISRPVIHSPRSRSSRYNIEIARYEFNKKGYRLLATDYKNVHERMPYICPNHPNKIKYMNLKDLLDGNGCRECYVDSISGSNSRFWNNDLTDEDRELSRRYPEYKEWRKSVYERDNYTCQCCHKKGGKLHAHHLDGYHWCEEKRTDVDNGITLCEECHAEFHDLYGKKNNTKEQFIEYMKVVMNWVI